ncbi:uncharacterized protein PRCAT00002119001 [Priceomyces carsonii]|uniref:uncharacterized protein n=1 Tax=Priceomyces carsonii TaxID=28549 RepID=UPI002ED9E6ED|nr:unnamed protein product [Priceomyces carsonii]
MIDYESVLEFEESLRSSSKWDNLSLLRNLELKIELNRSKSDQEKRASFEEKDLLDTFDSYDITKDDFATCSKCGHSLKDPNSYKSCCKVSSESGTLTTLEKTYYLLFINSPTSTINTLPCYTQLLFLQQGIPNQLRSLIWKKLFLLSDDDTPASSRLIFKNFQHSYSPEVSNQISKDLGRTFPSIDFFKEEKTIEDLATILNVYANYDVELGYCQGLLFLVGVLYYHFKGEGDLTFHVLVTIMEQESELHNIFTASTMSFTLEKWYGEFSHILKTVDNNLYEHLFAFTEPHVFLYQWWMSFASSHTSDISIVNRVMDFCILQGWKVGLFKISLGLLLTNKPIIMSLEKDDEEVVYQHLLNESKWGNTMNDIDLFFGNLLLSWDNNLFVFDQPAKSPEKQQQQHHHQSLTDRFKGISVSLSKSRSNSDASSSAPSSAVSHESSSSLFSSKLGRDELDSIYSITSDISESKSFVDYLKLPCITKHSTAEGSTESSELASMKLLLKRAYKLLDDNSKEASNLKEEISKVIQVE